ncbi:MAG: protein kinase [Planctomycetota bacterium]
MPDSDSPGQPNPAVTTLSLKPGDKVDAFTIVETIATTGSAVVYKAHDELLDRHVAIKQIILGQEDSDAALRKRIREEAAIHKRVSTSQPKHLIQFIDAVDDQRGLMLVGEYYPSKSLEELLQDTEQPLDERQALGIVAATAKGLEAIHSIGVVHRDLKPSNILLGDDGGLKICDFGLSALIESQDSLSLGSVRYMAPELLKSEPADGRADLYSLGIIAYEMLAGRANFDTAFRNVLRDQRNQAMRWMKWHTNLRVFAPTLDEYLPDLPTHLVQLVSRMMDKDQSRRVGSAEDVVEAIRRHFTGDGPDPDLNPTPVVNHPGMPAGMTPGTFSSPGDTTALPSRSKLPLILSGFLAFWVIVFGVVFLINDAKKSAALERLTDRATALLNDGNTAFADGNYQESVTSFQLVLDDWASDSEIGVRARRGLLKTQGRIAFVEGRYADAVDSFEQYKLIGGNPDNVDLLILEAKDNQAFAQIDETVLTQIADQQFAEALQVVKEAREQEWTDGQITRLDELESLVERSRAEALAGERFAEAKRLLETGDRTAAIATLADLAVLPQDAQAMLDKMQADEKYEKAISQGEESIRVGEFDEALAALRTALSLRPDPDLEARINRLDARRLAAEGVELFDRGEIDAASLRVAAALDKDPKSADALRLQSQIAVRTEFATAERRGDAALASGNLSAAVAAFEKALEISPGDDGVAGKLDRSRVRLALERARASIDLGDSAQAKALLDDARLIDPDNADIAALLESLDVQQRYQTLVAQGDAAREAAEFGRAKRLYRQAAQLVPGDEIKERLEDTDFRGFLAQARVFIADGELAAARAILEQARRIRFTPELGELIEQAEAPASETDDATAP